MLNRWDIQIAENKGYEQGIEEGKKQEIEERNTEIVKNLIKMNLSLEDIIKITNLSKEDIKKIEEEV